MQITVTDEMMAAVRSCHADIKRYIQVSSSVSNWEQLNWAKIELANLVIAAIDAEDASLKAAP